jgi:hypothetical protein
MSIYKKISISRFLSKIKKYIWHAQMQHQMRVDEYLYQQLFSNAKYCNPNTKRLNRFEFSAFSQNGEDGIIEEIFNRIGLTNRFFVEFGCAEGVETNSTYLLYKGWSGVWIDGGGVNINNKQKTYPRAIADKRLQAICSFITAENIEEIFKSTNVPYEFDLLSVDIDRNDYYVWDAIQSYSPRAVIVEYNAVYRPQCDFVIPYDANAVWDRSSHTGASLAALCQLGETKGYKLVGCCFAGVNAFFVREDLVGDKFEMPFTAENHYEPPRYFLSDAKTGHPRKIDL